MTKFLLQQMKYDYQLSTLIHQKMNVILKIKMKNQKVIMPKEWQDLQFQNELHDNLKDIRKQKE